MAKKQQFPVKVYVKREPDDDNPYLIADESLDILDGMEDGDVVGIYALTEVRTVRVRRELTK
jgi:hypothetical protein